MKNLLTNPNFPRTADMRVYHLGVRPGEVANRIVTVGSPSRAETIAAFFDENPKPFVLSSERGFLTITGRYKGVPVSVVSIGMGSSNMDFFVRETRESISGDMIIIRLGSCGALTDVPVSSVVVPAKSVQVSRNVDFDFADPGNDYEEAYRISRPVSADMGLADQLIKELEIAKPSTSRSLVVGGMTNASTDSFYSSQGRRTSFYDCNDDLLDRLQSSIPNLSTLEMETFHLYHLAACWNHRSRAQSSSGLDNLKGSSSNPGHRVVEQVDILDNGKYVIKVASAHMVFAARTTTSQDFITPQEVEESERWAGQAVLNTLVHTDIPKERLHEDAGSVWD